MSKHTFSCWVIHAFRRAAHINFLIEVRLVVWAAAVLAVTIRSAPLSRWRRAMRPHISAHIPPCALLRHQIRPVPVVRRRTGAKATPLAQLSFWFSHGAPDSFRQIRAVLATLTALRHHHHLLSAFHHKQELQNPLSSRDSASRQNPDDVIQDGGVCACLCGGASQGEGEASLKRKDAIRSDHNRRALQSARRELWDGSPFTLSPSFSWAVILNRPVVMMVPLLWWRHALIGCG